MLKELQSRGATFTIHDPFVREDDGYHIEQGLEAALLDCDAMVIMTAHDQYRSLDPVRLKHLLKNKVIIDGRNVLDPDKFIAEGYIFKGVGKGNINNRVKEGMYSHD